MSSHPVALLVFLAAICLLSTCKQVQPATKQLELRFESFSTQLPCNVPHPDTISPWCDHERLSSLKKFANKAVQGQPALGQYLRNQIAGLHNKRHDADSTLAWSEPAVLDSFLRRNDTLLMLESTRNILAGQAWEQRWNLDLARQHYHTALQIRQQLNGDEHPSAAVVYGYLANLYRQGYQDYPEALRLLEIEKSMVKKSDVTLPPEEEVKLNWQLCSVHRYQGNLAESLAYGLSAYLKMQNHCIEPHLTGKVFNEIGIAYFNDSKSLKKSRLWLEKAIEAIKNSPWEKDNLSLFYRNIAISYELENDSKKAAAWSELALQTCPTNALYRLAYHYYREAYNRLTYGKQLQKQAFPFLEKGIAILDGIGLVNHPAEARMYNLMGKCHEQNGNYNSAIKFYHLALGNNVYDFNQQHFYAAFELASIKKPQFEHFDIFLSDKARALYQAGLEAGNPLLLEKALNHFRLLDSLETKILNQESENFGNLPFAEHYKLFAEQYLSCLIALHEITRDSTLYNEFFSIMQASKAALLSKEVWENNFFRVLENKQFRRLRQLDRQIEALLFRLDDLTNENTPKLGNQLDSLLNCIDEIKQFHNQVNLLKSVAPIFSLNRVPIEEIRRSLAKNDGAYMEFFYGTEQLIAIYMDKQSIRILKTGVQKVDSLAQAFRKELTIPPSANISSTGKLDELAISLGSRLLSPLLPTNRMPSRLAVAPDGLLSFLPLEAFKIMVKGQQKTLLELMPVSYAASASLFTGQRNHTLRKKSAYAKIALFSFSDDQTIKESLRSQAGKLPELVHSWKSVQNIAGLFSKSNCFLTAGKKATKRSFLQEIEKSYDIIHLSTHANVFNEKRLGGRIFFRGSSGNNSLDTLYAHELPNTPIPASLVLLDACETGMGTDYPGEGVFSLARAFLRTGTPTVIQSLWVLDDGASGRITRSFYQQLLIEKDPVIALWKAKLEYFHQANGRFRHPYFWGSLVGLCHSP